MIEEWAHNVMRDPKSNRTEIKVAWGLCFLFNDKDARAWPSHEKLGARIGLSGESVRTALRTLAARRHILRTRELIKGEMLSVTRPVFNRQVVEGQPPRARKGGRPSTTPLVDGQPTDRLTDNHHVYLDDTKKGIPREENVQSVRTASEPDDSAEPSEEDWKQILRKTGSQEIEAERVQRDPTATDDPSSNPSATQGIREERASTVDAGSPPVADAEIEDDDFDDDIPDPATLRASR
ncbi:hypothetical protein [Methylobacterium ajmalii]|jgi:hypothetical protein|uniref:hypothetical protein n=1 Tax=Methylobacterium ajmalii TaxID=2738439 RepID=UPI001909DD2D|nr:hypothetical protein [Methylobacterium ajmalii]MBK3398926.1 hypothetical protein [Methylobacterium ajmalii]MBK3409583.1 hypothetical protein [Methylobacterium ajmalii]MBK3425690.1 hypothetical protein [Methylobacterium ajmalii]